MEPLRALGVLTLPDFEALGAGPDVFLIGLEALGTFEASGSADDSEVFAAFDVLLFTARFGSLVPEAGAPCILTGTRLERPAAAVVRVLFSGFLVTGVRASRVEARMRSFFAGGSDAVVSTWLAARLGRVMLDVDFGFLAKSELIVKCG